MSDNLTQDGGENENHSPETSGRWQLLRDVLAFQFKLALDGLRDILLSPLSIGAAILGVIASPGDPGKYFSRLLALGHRSDRWINLFGAIEHYEGEMSSDVVVRQVEDVVVARYRQRTAASAANDPAKAPDQD